MSEAGKRIASGLLAVSVAPELATAWSLSADRLTYTFKLRDDVSWVRYTPTGGVQKLGPVTAPDVVYGVKRTCDPRTASTYAYVDYIIAGCKALNTVCAEWGDTDCCLGLTCNQVREHGLLCCIPYDQPGCTKDKDCCDAECVEGVCRQCGTLQTCQISSGPVTGQIFCCQQNQTCCSAGGCAPPGGECCNGSPCDTPCDVNGNCPPVA